MHDDFEQILQSTITLEGGYSNNLTDPGGETFMGIARKKNPDWEGWAIVDRIKAQFPSDFERQLSASDELSRAVSARYRSHYWSPIRGDEIPSYLIAKELFDTAVNQGPKSAVMYLQQALNLLNRNGLDWSDIAEDGKIGPATLAALQKFLNRRKDPVILLVWMNAFQAKRYIEIMRRSPSQETFATGWVKRLFVIAPDGPRRRGDVQTHGG